MSSPSSPPPPDSDWEMTDHPPPSSHLTQSWLATENAALRSTLVFPLFYSDGSHTPADAAAFPLSGRPARQRSRRVAAGVEGEVSDTDSEEEEDDDDRDDLLPLVPGWQGSAQPPPLASGGVPYASRLQPSAFVHQWEEEAEDAIDHELEALLRDLKQNIASPHAAQLSLHTTAPRHRERPPAAMSADCVLRCRLCDCCRVLCVM